MNHTADLNTALAEALRHSLPVHADAIRFRINDEDPSVPVEYMAIATKYSLYLGTAHYPGVADSPLAALNVAMAALRTAGGAL